MTLALQRTGPKSRKRAQLDQAYAKSNDSPSSPVPLARTPGAALAAGGAEVAGGRSLTVSSEESCTGQAPHNCLFRPACSCKGVYHTLAVALNGSSVAVSCALHDSHAEKESQASQCRCELSPAIRFRILAAGALVFSKPSLDLSCPFIVCVSWTR